MTTARSNAGRGLRRVSLPLLAAGTIASGLLTFVGGLGMTMILGDLLQERGSSLRGWSMVGIYASQIIAVLLGWIAFAFDRNRLAASLASWPILLGFFVLTGLMFLLR